MFKVIRGQKFRKKSGYGKLKLNGLHKDHLPEISKRPLSLIQIIFSSFGFFLKVFR